MLPLRQTCACIIVNTHNPRTGMFYSTGANFAIFTEIITRVKSEPSHLGRRTSGEINTGVRQKSVPPALLQRQGE